MVSEHAQFGALVTRHRFVLPSHQILATLLSVTPLTIVLLIYFYIHIMLMGRSKNPTVFSRSRIPIIYTDKISRLHKYFRGTAWQGRIYDRRPPRPLIKNASDNVLVCSVLQPHPHHIVCFSDLTLLVWSSGL